MLISQKSIILRLKNIHTIKIYVGIALITAVLVISGAAFADIILPEDIEESCAEFTFTPSHNRENTLELSMITRASGRYSYSFAITSGDSQEVLETSEKSCTEGTYKHEFIFAKPEEGQAYRYELRASFVMRYTGSRIDFARNITVRNNKGAIYVFIERKK